MADGSDEEEEEEEESATVALQAERLSQVNDIISDHMTSSLIT